MLQVLQVYLRVAGVAGATPATRAGIYGSEAASRSPHSNPSAAYVSIRQHTSAYVSMRQHTSACVMCIVCVCVCCVCVVCVCVCVCVCVHARQLDRRGLEGCVCADLRPYERVLECG